MENIFYDRLLRIYPQDSKKELQHYARYVEDDPEWVHMGLVFEDYRDLRETSLFPLEEEENLNTEE